MSNVFNRGGIINERKINIKGCCKQLLDTYTNMEKIKKLLTFKFCIVIMILKISF